MAAIVSVSHGNMVMYYLVLYGNFIQSDLANEGMKTDIYDILYAQELIKLQGLCTGYAQTLEIKNGNSTHCHFSLVHLLLRGRSWGNG